MKRIESRTVHMDVRSTQSVKEQMKAQGVHIAGHATASLERSRQAILQLGAANILSVADRARCEKRFRVAVRDTLHRYIGGKYEVIEGD